MNYRVIFGLRYNLASEIPTDDAAVHSKELISILDAGPECSGSRNLRWVAFFPPEPIGGLASREEKCEGGQAVQLPSKVRRRASDFQLRKASNMSDHWKSPGPMSRPDSEVSPRVPTFTTSRIMRSCGKRRWRAKAPSLKLELRPFTIDPRSLLPCPPPPQVQDGKLSIPR